MVEATELAVGAIRDWVAQYSESALQSITPVAFNVADLAVIEAALGA
jgi:hypothetical protein